MVNEVAAIFVESCNKGSSRTAGDEVNSIRLVEKLLTGRDFGETW